MSNWAYARDPDTAAVTSGTYKGINVEKLDRHTVRVSFPSPRPFWADAFVGPNGMIIPKHLFESYSGAKSREAPANLRPIGESRHLSAFLQRPSDELYRASEAALDPVKRAALFIKMNDLVVSKRAVIPIVYRPSVAARNEKLQAMASGWDSTFWALQDWFMKG